eukprot:comp10940_c0_seq1/m.5517 comp10940_c0_seq1/g.5517  ORF comp10940_c0_seq1/g.5517 comp10940_c0_seq1/m.5517 type:complete len:218 (-) comp10940_c0_seq1:208-861(-)
MSGAVVIEAVEKHTATLIFLHGLGDSGHGWSPVMKMIRSKHMKIICPHAPNQKVTLNMGMRMPSWFDLFGLSPNDPEDAPGIKESAKKVQGIIEEEIKAGIPSNRIFLGGFSQGGAISLYAGLTFGQPLGGLTALSTWVPLRSEWPAIMNEANKKTPIFMAHGNADQVVPYQWGKMSAEKLKEFGLDITFKTYPGMGHSACDEEIEDLQEFVTKILP